MLGARAGVATSAATIVYFSVAFALLRAGPNHDPLLTMRYACGDVAIAFCLALSLLGTRERERMVARVRAANATADALRRAEKQRLDEELALAMRIQTALLPRDLGVEGLSISASMLPVAGVGGGYYDVLPFEGGAWLCIGDVVGRGLDAGLAMLMVQSAVSVLVQDDPAHDPEQALRAIDATLYQNLRQRLGRDEHAALTLLRYHRDGSLLFAGAHQELLVFRAAERRCEAAASGVTLGDDDVLVLYTNVLTEVEDGTRRPFGRERIEAEILRAEGQPVDTIRQAIFDAVCAFSGALANDVTLVVARYHAPTLADAALSSPVLVRDPRDRG
jgi:serine phosphatase RsbU (regulator of sigma subunit)